MYGHKRNRRGVFNLHFKKGYVPKNLTYHQALINNAVQIKDDLNGTFDVLLSGGIDSEIIVRINNDLKIKQNLYTFKFEDDINIRDVESAKKICRDLGIKLNVVDFNLQWFIENEAYAIYQKTYFPKLAQLIRVGWLEYLDNIPVHGNGEPYWCRKLKGDFTKKSTWEYDWAEFEFTHSIWSRLSGRPILGEWYAYTPEVCLSNSVNYRTLLDDLVPGKTSSWSSRCKIHQEFWPDVEDKIKLVGFEGAEGNPGVKPHFMQNFQDTVMTDTTDASFRLSEDELQKIFL
jgi:hypothetical protein